MRYFLQFSYFGKYYHGWQNQPNAITVQQVLEEKMSVILGESIDLVGAGRTDAGVHAKQMYAHFDIEKDIEDKKDLLFRVNAFLPDDIAVQSIIEVQEDAHARFDAITRTYEYWVTQEKNPFLIDASYLVKKVLDVNAMNKAAKVLFEYNDFECFSKSNTDVRTFLCDIKYAKWVKVDDKLVFTIQADRFLRNMVRAIVGTLLDVGLGKNSVENVNTIIKSKDRSKAGASVPANGLYLTKVTYPNTIIKNG